MWESQVVEGMSPRVLWADWSAGHMLRPTTTDLRSCRTGSPGVLATPSFQVPGGSREHTVWHAGVCGWHNCLRLLCPSSTVPVCSQAVRKGLLGSVLLRCQFGVYCFSGDIAPWFYYLFLWVRLVFTIRHRSGPSDENLSQPHTSSALGTWSLCWDKGTVGNHKSA